MRNLNEITRTQIELNPDLKRTAKITALLEGITFRQFVEEAIADRIAKSEVKN